MSESDETAIGEPPKQDSCSKGPKPKSWSSRQLRHFGVLIFAMLAFYYPLTFERNRAWSSHTRLWESAYAVNPRSHQVRHELALGLINDGRIKDAEPVLRSAIRDDHRVS